jgi:hypothetical protein
MWSGKGRWVEEEMMLDKTGTDTMIPGRKDNPCG